MEGRSKKILFKTKPRGNEEVNEDKKHLNKIWDKALVFFEEELTSVSFATWIKPIKIFDLNKDKLILSVANDFSKSIVESRYTNLIKTIISQITGQDIDVEYIINEENINNVESIIKPVEDVRKIVEKAKSKEINIEERVEKQLVKIARYIETAANDGDTSTSVILDAELHNKDEIYDKVLENLLCKGYKAELNNYEFDTISISW